MFCHLLVAYDASPPAERALEHAIELAAALRARLTVVTVASSVPRFAHGAGIDVEALVRAAEAEAADRLRAAVDRVPADVSVTSVVRRGHAAAEILAVAAEVDADLIVMGSRGRGRLASNVLGSVAADVHFNTRLPMLVVHPGDAVAEGEGR